MTTEKRMETVGHSQEPFEDIKAFASAVKQMLEQRHPSARVEIHEVTKNNNLLLNGIVIREKGCNTAPTVYLEDFIEAYRNGKPLDEICRMIEEINQTATPDRNFDVNSIMDFSEVKDKICYKLVNADKNIARLNQIPHRLWQDLAVIYYVPVSLELFVDGDASITVNNGMLELWGVDEDTLYKHACRNTPTLFNADILPVMDMIKDIFQDMGAKMPAGVMGAGESEDMLPLYAATNNRKINGAAVLLYDGVLENFARQVNGDFYILPSSIHETLFLPVQPDADEHGLTEMVRNINAGCLDPEDILSDNVYHYCAKDNSIQLVS